MSSYTDPTTKLAAHRTRLDLWDLGQRPAPVTVEIDLTNRCDLGCSACHMAYTHTRGPLASRDKPVWFEGTGDQIDLGVLTRALSEIRAAGVQGVVWSGGGEPTLHPRWVEATQTAQRLGLQVGMYSHGGRLADAPADVLRALTWVVVSLDCVDAASYRAYKGADRFEAACSGIRLLAQEGVTVGASFLLSQETHRQALEMLRLSRSLGSTYTVFRPMIETDPHDVTAIAGRRDWVKTWPTDTPVLLNNSQWLQWLAAQKGVELDVARFIEWRDWQPHPASRGYDACEGIRLHSTVTPDGRVWVCPNRRGMADSCLGDLTTESFAAIWSRHPGQWTDFRECRAMCRLHTLNTAIAKDTPTHAAFI